MQNILKLPLKIIHKLHYSVFLLLMIVLLFVGVIAARNNNLRMIELRNAVYSADKNNGNVELALKNLREFVYSHMNTNLNSGGNSIKPPIQLKYTYDRLVVSHKAEIAKANAKISSDADKYCATPKAIAKYPFSRVACQQDYIAARNVSKEQVIPAALYQFDFHSPRWSPDLAGYSLLLSGLMLIVGVIKFIFGRVVK